MGTDHNFARTFVAAGGKVAKSGPVAVAGVVGDNGAGRMRGEAAHAAPPGEVGMKARAG